MLGLTLFNYKLLLPHENYFRFHPMGMSHAQKFVCLFIALFNIPDTIGTFFPDFFHLVSGAKNVK